MQEAQNAMHDAPRVTLVALEGGRAALAGESALVCIYGPPLGRRWALDRAELLIGRDESCDVVVDLDTVSRRHCRIAACAEGLSVRDLGSTNGTWVDDEAVAPYAGRTLRSGDRLRVGGAIFKFLQGDDVESLYREEIFRTIIVDGLTHAYNRRYFVDFLEREMARCRRHARPLSLVFFDLDHFQRVNDDFGHLTGDAVLRELAGLVRAQVRREDCFARWGGEEFAVILSETDLASARVFAERLRRGVAEHAFRAHGEVIPVRLSLGVAAMRRDMREPSRFLEAADARLYEAKHQGRDRVCG